MVAMLAYKSFSKKNSRKYFITSIIIKAFVAALFLSAFIYLATLGITNYFLHTVSVLIGFWLLFTLPKSGYFFTGFFIGIFWFYWISLSFRYYGELSWLIPFVILAIGIVYGICFFMPALLARSPYLRAAFLLLFSQVAPFGFNWFNFELMFYYTPFGLTPLHVAFLMGFVLVLQNKKNNYKLLAIPFFIASLDFSNRDLPEPLPFPISVERTDIPQDEKWEDETKKLNILDNFARIEKAIDEGKRLIVFPETAFALYMNKNESLMNRLLDYSKDIAIITGALAYEDGKYYNSAYFFDKGETKRADKVVLVPFAEKIPLPSFITNFINKIFFDGASDFSQAPNPTDFEIDGVKIRSAVCFEGSTKALRKDKPQYMTVVSNNAWFTPSTESVMQDLMLSLYASKSNTIIYHSINGEGNEIITPRESLIQKLF